MCTLCTGVGLFLYLCKCKNCSFGSNLPTVINYSLCAREMRTHNVSHNLNWFQDFMLTAKVSFCMSAFRDNVTPHVSIEYKEPFSSIGKWWRLACIKLIDCGYLGTITMHWVPLPCTRVHRNVWHVVHPGLPAAKTTRQGLRTTIQITIRDTLHLRNWKRSEKRGECHAEMILRCRNMFYKRG